LLTYIIKIIKTHLELHNEELNDLYCSPNIVLVIKSRMIWAEHLARMEERRSVYRVLVGKSTETHHWGDQEVDGKILS
jgi:hypothetical protein